MGPPVVRAIKNPGKHHKWMALGMLRGLRTQLPNIAQDPFRQAWIAPWISNQLGVECKTVRTWFALYRDRGGDDNAIVSGPWMLGTLPGQLDSPSTQSPVAEAPEEAALASPAPDDKPAEPTLRAGNAGKKKDKPFDRLAASREIRWQAVGMARALDTHLPVIAQMWGFDEVIASELHCSPKTIKAWLAEYRQTGTVDPHTVPPSSREQSLHPRTKGTKKWKIGGVYG